MKRIRYNRVVFVIVVLITIVSLLLYLYYHQNYFYEYDGDIQTYVCSYQQDKKIYTFDLKGFQIDEENYVSLNDLYNVIVIMDEKAHVYMQVHKHMMVYELSDITYYFHYGQDRIVYNNDCIKLKDYDSHIYISHKNVYINVFFIEKLLFNNEKKIKFQNENAIIE